MNNSLTEVHPEIVSEWSEKNIPLKPDEANFSWLEEEDYIIKSQMKRIHKVKTAVIVKGGLNS